MRAGCTARLILPCVRTRWCALPQAAADKRAATAVQEKVLHAMLLCTLLTVSVAGYSRAFCCCTIAMCMLIPPVCVVHMLCADGCRKTSSGAIEGQGVHACLEQLSVTVLRYRIARCSLLLCITVQCLTLLWVCIIHTQTAADKRAAVLAQEKVNGIHCGAIRPH